MKLVLAYTVAFVIALLSGKLIAGAISGMLITPLVISFKDNTIISRYLVPFVQGIAMGFVAVCTAKWVLMAFSLEIGWTMFAMLALGFVVICCVLVKRIEERHFHIAAGAGELLAILLSSSYFLGA